MRRPWKRFSTTRSHGWATGFAKILGGQLRRFAGAYGTEPLDKVTAADIEAWLGSLRSPRGNRALLNPTTRNKFRKSLKSLFSYGLAPARAWCHRNPLADIEPEKVKTSEPQAYSPEDSAKIMQTALVMNSPLLPSLALGMFAAAKVKGIFDGCRHSFITYRTAETRDVARVADECGNSPNIIKKHYRELVTGEAAKKYFAIRPEKKTGRKSKITNIETGRKSA